MKTSISLLKVTVSLCFATLVVFISSLDWWGCKTELITGPISNISTSDIVKEVANANTVDKSIIAIQHLIQKIGFGYPNSESKYGKYSISNEQIANIAKSHSMFISNGSDSIYTYNIGALYDSILVLVSYLSNLSGNEWTFTGSLNETLNTLQQESQNALINMELPNNSILINIVAENGAIPSQIPLYNSTKVKSPIQVFLLAIWIITEYERYQTIIDKINWCKTLCIAGTAACVTACWLILKIPPAPQICSAWCTAAGAICLATCHDQGGGDIYKKPITK